MQVHAPGVSITSNAGPPLNNLNAEVASARWRAAPLRAGSIDARGALPMSGLSASFRFMLALSRWSARSLVRICQINSLRQCRQ